MKAPQYIYIHRNYQSANCMLSYYINLKNQPLVLKPTSFASSTPPQNVGLTQLPDLSLRPTETKKPLN